MSVQLSHSVVSDSLRPYGLQHARLPCPSPSLGACSNSCPLSWPSNRLVFCRPLLLRPSVFPSIRVFSNESTLHIRWPKYWSFSISPSNEYSGLIPLGLTGLNSLQSKSLSESSLASQFESINSLALRLFHGATLISIHDYWKNLSFD